MDFDLHGVVGVRLVAPTPADVAVVERQLGPLQKDLSREPDILVRFVDRMPDDGPLTYVDWPGSGFTGNGFYLLRGRHGIAARARLELDTAGQRCEIVCERRGGPVPHLLALINLTATAHGVLPLHASAFDFEGQGVLATGWAKGGKTELLLAFAAHGARYIGDEWVYLTATGDMFGVPEPIRLWYWHIAQLPHLAQGLSRPDRVRLGVLPRVSAAAETAADRIGGAGGVGSVLRRAAPVVRRQSAVQISPYEVFGADNVVLRGRLDTIVLVTSHDQPGVTVQPADASVVARRMLASLTDERQPFLAAYRQYCFAFPNRRSDVVESVTERESALIEAAFAGRRCFQLAHPYPMTLADLVAPLRSALQAD